MRSSQLTIGLAILVSVTTSAAGGQSAIPQAATRSVPSVEITARLDEPDGDVVVNLRNTAKSPLEAWRLTFTYATRASASSAFSTTTDTFAALAVPIRRPEVGPLDPAESRELRFPVPSIRVLKSVRVDGAFFGDQSFQGDIAVRDEIVHAREAQAAALAKWIPVLEEAITKDVEQARQLLRKALADSAASDAGNTAAEATRHTVEQLLTSPNLPAAILEMRHVFERLRELALRHRPPSGPRL